MTSFDVYMMDLYSKKLDIGTAESTKVIHDDMSIIRHIKADMNLRMYYAALYYLAILHVQWGALRSAACICKL